MLAVLAYSTANGLARVLPAPLAEPLAVALARVAFELRVPARGALEANLRRLLPESDERARRRQARAAFEHFALAFARFLSPIRDAGEPPAVIGAHHLERARTSGRGVILLSAHLGDWEEGAAFLAGLGVTVHLAARRQPARSIERVFAARRAQRRVAVLPREGLFVAAAGALRRGEWVALMADRSATRAGGGSVCAWAGTLARRTGAIVLPAVFVRPLGGRAALCVEPPLTSEQCRDGAFRDAMKGWLARWPDHWAAFEPLPEGFAG